MTSKIIVNTIEGDVGVSSVTFNDTINASGDITVGNSVTVGNTVVNSTSISIGNTNTAGRTAGIGTVTGSLVYDTDRGLMVYNGNKWQIVKSSFEATGGTLNTSSRIGYNVHTYLGSDTFEVITGTRSVEYLIVAGGGAGGGSVGGGGGAGGYLAGNISLGPGIYTIQVGGGAAATAQQTAGVQGVPSFIDGVGITSVTSIGGGGGASSVPSSSALLATSGGSGGGGAYYPSENPDFVAINGAAGTPGQGFAGGNASPPAGGGGGGGASEVGSNSPTNNQDAGDGGDGLTSSITGTSLSYAGGGGGGGGAIGGNGGLGGGAGGGSGQPGTPGTGGAGYNPGSDGVLVEGGAGGTNSGGGGGAGWSYSGGSGGAGGSGIVIIAYEA